MTGEKSKIFNKLLSLHDNLYNSIEILETIKAPESIRYDLAALLNNLDHMNTQFEHIIESSWWNTKGEN